MPVYSVEVVVSDNDASNRVRGYVHDFMRLKHWECSYDHHRISRKRPDKVHIAIGFTTPPMTEETFLEYHSELKAFLDSRPMATKHGKHSLRTDVDYDTISMETPMTKHE